MPANLIFITGATGFIGSQTVNAALAAGYRVRVSIRRKAQEHSIRSWSIGPENNLEFVHIPDLTDQSAFRGLLNDVDYIFHLASPMPGKGEDIYKDYVDPAVAGTLAILKEAKGVERVKLVIVMSSILALFPLGAMNKPPVIPKANSNERIPVDLDRRFPSGYAGHSMKYTSSKIVAHQATQDFLQQEKPNFKLITFHPTFVIGDSLIQKTAKDIDGMNAVFWTSLSAKKRMLPTALVNVRDVADAHLKAVDNYESLRSGTEYILSAPILGWVNAIEIVKEHYPQVDVSPQKGPSPLDDWQVDTSPAVKDLGMKWRSGKELIRHLFEQQLALRQRSNL